MPLLRQRRREIDRRSSSCPTPPFWFAIDDGHGRHRATSLAERLARVRTSHAGSTRTVVGVFSAMDHRILQGHASALESTGGQSGGVNGTSRAEANRGVASRRSEGRAKTPAGAATSRTCPAPRGRPSRASGAAARSPRTRSSSPERSDFSRTPLLDEDRRPGAQGQGHGVAGPRVDRRASRAVAVEVDHGEEGVVLAGR